MTNHGRKYGEKESHPFYVWNGVLEAKHRRRIGPAVWEFLWLLDCITKEKDGIGKVWNGKPVNYQKIAESFEVNEKTVRSHFDRLEKKGYIERTLTPRGHSIRVLNSKKWTKSGRKEMSDHPAKMPDHVEENVRPNKTKQLDKAPEEAAGSILPPESPLWKLVGLRSDRLPAEFVRLCEGLFSAKGGQPLAEFVGVCMDSWQFIGNKIPGPFVRAANTLRQQRRMEPEAKEIEFLPELPFKPKGVQCQAQN